MSMLSGSTRSTSSDSSDRFRVILVGRTGLDQVLRREPRVELIRARDTFGAIGELADPIDLDSPNHTILLVDASIEPDDGEIESFIAGIRMTDSSARVLRVGSARTHYDGCVSPDATLEQLIEVFDSLDFQKVEIESSLKFFGRDEEVDDADEIDIVETQSASDSAHVENHQESASETPATPEVVVVMKDTSTIQRDRSEEQEQSQHQSLYEEAQTIHHQVLIGAEESTQSTTRAAQPNASFYDPNAAEHDLKILQTILSGQSMLVPAIAALNARAGRSDITFVQGEDADSVSGIEIKINRHIAGKLVCTSPNGQSWMMSQGNAILQREARWLEAWIKLEAQQAELRKAAFTDSLTGAWNRRYFSRYLDAAITQSRIARQPLTVMVFDIDGFKHYNDTYGHSAGDEILIETVRLLESVIRPSDRVCRVGGDEFAVIFYEPQGPRDPESKPLESIYHIAKRFQKQICNHRFPKLGEEAMGTLTVSGGLASYPWDGHNAETLLDQADQLAMESKRNGKNAITLGPGAESVCKIDR